MIIMANQKQNLALRVLGPLLILATGALLLRIVGVPPTAWVAFVNALAQFPMLYQQFGITILWTLALLVLQSLLVLLAFVLILYILVRSLSPGFYQPSGRQQNRKQSQHPLVLRETSQQEIPSVSAQVYNNSSSNTPIGNQDQWVEQAYSGGKQRQDEKIESRTSGSGTSDQALQQTDQDQFEISPSSLRSVPLATPTSREKSAQQAPPSVSHSAPVLEEDEHGSSDSLLYSARSHIGLNPKRTTGPNEDSLLAVTGMRGVQGKQPQAYGLFVVSDGMGGHDDGDKASKETVKAIREVVLPSIDIAYLTNEALAHLLVAGVQRANTNLHERNEQEQGRTFQGATVTAALVLGQMAYIVNVGDSRTYLFRDGNLSQVTNDHSEVNEMIARKEISEDDVYTHPRRGVITRSVGEHDIIDIDTFFIRLRDDDILLLCSDGLWEMVRRPMLQEIITTNSQASPSHLSEELLQAALDGGGRDNVTVIVVELRIDKEGQ